MGNNVQALSDEELTEFCRPLAGESRIRLGCILTLVIWLLLLACPPFLLIYFGTELPVLAAFCLLEGVCLSSFFFVYPQVRRLLDAPYRRRTDAHMAELKRRYEIHAFPDLLEEARKATLSDTGPDWVLVLRGAALPHGGALYVRADLCSVGRSCTLYARQAPLGWYFPDFGPDKFLNAQAALDANAARELLAAVERAFPHDIQNRRRFEVCDGFPCDFAVLRRQPREEKVIECNAAALKPDHVIVLLLRLSQEYRKAMVVGSCDSTGNVRVGHL